MNNNQLVSVNITTYNRAHLLPRCLDSVISQTYENIEVIIVDDCSTDNTAEVVKQYSDKDSRIKYFKHEKNSGNASARNTALKNANGFYIAFMDDDDEWIDKEKLVKQVEILNNDKENKIAVVCSSVNLIDESQNIKPKIIEKPENLKEKILMGNGMIYSPTVMTKKSIMDRLEGFDINLPRGVDSDFYRRCIVVYAYDVYFMKEITTNIHEYGNDRMTPQDNIISLEKSVKSIDCQLEKYKEAFKSYPIAKNQRRRQLYALYYKLLKKKVSAKYFKNFLVNYSMYHLNK